jgi:hypothetical protein
MATARAKKAAAARWGVGAGGKKRRTKKGKKLNVRSEVSPPAPGASESTANHRKGGD